SIVLNFLVLCQHFTGFSCKFFTSNFDKSRSTPYFHGTKERFPQADSTPLPFLLFFNVFFGFSTAFAPCGAFDLLPVARGSLLRFVVAKFIVSHAAQRI